MVDRIDILEVGRSERSDQLLCALLGVWHDSVRASHRFLSRADIWGLRPHVRRAILEVERLFVVCSASSEAGFMGVQGRKIEMLFLAPRMMGLGVGRRLVELAVNNFEADRVDVNEQNPLAVNFYRHMGFVTFRRDAADDYGNPFPVLRMRLEGKSRMETERLVLRRWRDDDAAALYRYASDVRVGPVAGWLPHTSVADSLEVIRTVFSAPETYAVVLRSTGEPVGSVGIMFGDGVHSADIAGREAEIGYWIGVPYWGRGLIPEAVERLLQRCFEDLDLDAVWCGHYDGNMQSRRVMEKCGFSFHHTERGKVSPLGDLRTEHFLRLTADQWRRNRPHAGGGRSGACAEERS